MTELQSALLQQQLQQTLLTHRWAETFLAAYVWLTTIMNNTESESSCIWKVYLWITVMKFPNFLRPWPKMRAFSSFPGLESSTPVFQNV